MMLGVLVFGSQACGNRSLEPPKADMEQLEKQLEKNAKLGIRATEFPKGLDWFNVSKPLQMERLKGKVVLLDFWTFCCINCMHVIPELKRLEEKYPNELVVIGVHSPKFANERDSENIKQSILRYEVHHPVINDPELTLWQAYGVHAWPTLVLIDPEGHLVLSLSGEGHYELLNRAVGNLIQRAQSKGILKSGPIPTALEEAKTSDSVLKFPGKIFADGDHLIVADSNHNRILILDTLGNVLETIGNSQSGSADGNFQQAEFNHPQGIFWEGNFIYVADTENHLIRQIDLKEKVVETIAGTGVPGSYLHGKAEALKTPLNSPWDLVKVGDHLYIAMAGAHQIWSLNLRDGKLDLFVGSGREDIMDGSATSSALAQPSGITFDGTDTFYFADSEVSAVRSFSLKSREVKTLIGQGLFDFGDQDGSWAQALLQHPLGVYYTDGIVYVADTYNDKIKTINLKEKTIRTIAGSSKNGFQDGKPGALYEPGGLSVVGGNLFVADTNNHAIRVLDLASGALSTLQIKDDRLHNTKIASPDRPSAVPTVRHRSTKRPTGARSSGRPPLDQPAAVLETPPRNDVIPPPVLSAKGGSSDASRHQTGGGIIASEAKQSQKNPFLQTVEYPKAVISKKVKTSVNILLPKEHEFTEGEPLHFKAELREGDAVHRLKEGQLPQPPKGLPIVFDLNPAVGGQSTLEIEIGVPYCTTVSPKLCKFKSLKLIQPVLVSPGGKSMLQFEVQVQ